MAGELGPRVVVTRDDRGWRAEIPELAAQRRAGSLYALDRRVRGLLGRGWVEYDFHTGDAALDRLVAGVRAARRAAQVAEERARGLTERVIALAPGLSVRDLGVMLEISHQRVHQLLRRRGQPGEGVNGAG
ncbi:MAG: hypothetical protein E6G35_15325 [Actinobacteria bacterium]|nr:MAG: hypothetical protein E6G35_15325 [Actinomycetota bacterium]